MSSDFSFAATNIHGDRLPQNRPNVLSIRVARSLPGDRLIGSRRSSVATLSCRSSSLRTRYCGESPLGGSVPVMWQISVVVREAPKLLRSRTVCPTTKRWIGTSRPVGRALPPTKDFAEPVLMIVSGPVPVRRRERPDRSEPFVVSDLVSRSQAGG